MPQFRSVLRENRSVLGENQVQDGSQTLRGGQRCPQRRRRTAPRRLQEGPKLGAQKRVQGSKCFQASIWIRFGRKSGPRRLPDAPRRPKMSPETSQNGPKTLPRVPQVGGSNAIWCQLGRPKSASKAQNASKTLQEASRPRF